MKTYKRMGAVLLCMALCMAGVGAGADLPARPANEAFDTFLLREGMALAALMQALAESEYPGTFTSQEEVLDVITDIAAQNYTEPDMAYVIGYNFNLVMSLLQVSMGDLPEEVTAYLRTRLPSALPSQLNSMGGVTLLAATSVLQASRTAHAPDAPFEECMLLLSCGEEAPYGILMTYVMTGDEIVTITGQFVLMEAMQTLLSAEPSDMEALMVKAATGIAVTGYDAAAVAALLEEAE